MFAYILPDSSFEKSVNLSFSLHFLITLIYKIIILNTLKNIIN